MVQVEARVFVVRHLRRLERASSAADIVKELQHLSPSLGQSRLLSAMPLPALAALAEAHLRDRLEPARDPLTGLHDARAFSELFRVHARNAEAMGGEAIAVVLTLIGVGDPRVDRNAASDLKQLAAACTTCVAEGDYVGRVGLAATAALPRHGGMRGARSVATRLVECCRELFAQVERPVRISVELKDSTDTVRDSEEIELSV
jgi:GGDEF domain-containing protein